MNRQRKNKEWKYQNQGSAIVEVTLIMPIILMIMVLFITMLLGVLRQAETHAQLMLAYVDTDGKEQEGKVLQDAQVYSEAVVVKLARGYEIYSEEEQILRTSVTEEKIRRWQILEGVVAK